VPTLNYRRPIRHVDPAHMEMMASKVQKGRYLFCADGSHLPSTTTRKVYVEGVIRFIRDVDAGRF